MSSANLTLQLLKRFVSFSERWNSLKSISILYNVSKFILNTNHFFQIHRLAIVLYSIFSNWFYFVLYSRKEESNVLSRASFTFVSFSQSTEMTVVSRENQKRSDEWEIKEKNKSNALFSPRYPSVNPFEIYSLQK